MNIAIIAVVLGGGVALGLLFFARARNAALGAWSLASRGKAAKEPRASDPGK